jgi:hypothetical protein
MRIVRNIKLLRALHLCRRCDFHRAAEIVEALRAKNPKLVSLSIFRADIFLFSKDLKTAKNLYEHSKETLMRSSISENRRFLLAYVNFRLRAIECKNNGTVFRDADQFAGLINRMKASGMLKAIFELPEP